MATKSIPIDEFMVKMTTAFPKAEMGQDNDGQIIVYTGLWLTQDNDSNEIVVESDPNGN